MNIFCQFVSDSYKHLCIQFIYIYICTYITRRNHIVILFHTYMCATVSDCPTVFDCETVLDCAIVLWLRNNLTAAGGRKGSIR